MGTKLRDFQIASYKDFVKEGTPYVKSLVGEGDFYVVDNEDGSWTLHYSKEPFTPVPHVPYINTDVEYQNRDSDLTSIYDNQLQTVPLKSGNSYIKTITSAVPGIEITNVDGVVTIYNTDYVPLPETYTEQALAYNATALWEFNIDTDGTVPDATGNGYDIEVEGFYYGESLTGDAGHSVKRPSISVGNVAPITVPVGSVASPTGLTIAFWTLLDDTPVSTSRGQVISVGEGASALSVRMNYTNNINAQVSLVSSVLPAMNYSDVDVTIPRDSNRHFVVYTYDRASGTAVAYLDGSPVSTVNVGTNRNYGSELNLLSTSNDNLKYTDAIDGIALWDTPLELSAVEDLYYAGGFERPEPLDYVAYIKGLGPDMFVTFDTPYYENNGEYFEDEMQADRIYDLGTNNAWPIPTIVPGATGYAMQKLSTSGNSSTSTPIGNSSFSYSFWVSLDPTGTSSNSYILSRNNSFEILFHYGGTNTISVFTNNSPVISSSTLPITLPRDGTPHFVVYTYDNDTGEIVSYLDGTQMGTYTTIAGRASSIQNSLMIGGSSGSYFSDKLDCVAMWKKVLTPTEVLDMYTVTQ